MFHHPRTGYFGLIIGLVCLFMPQPSHAGTIWDRVKQSGVVICGVTTSGIGLVSLNENGQWEGIFADMCRAIAAAATGDARNAQFVEVSNKNRFEAVRLREIDVLTGGTTWTMERDTRLGLAFPIIYLYDGQGFMAHKTLGARSFSEVKEGKICVVSATTTHDNLEDYLYRINSKIKILKYISTEGALSAFYNHHCDVFSTDRMALFGYRNTMAPNPSDYVVFPEVISKEPLGPAISQDDPEWFDIVHWAIAATILAEEKGISSQNAESLRSSKDTEIQRLTGNKPGFGAWLGLDDSWAYRVITQVGSFGEMYERNIGQQSPLKIDRGLNALWTKGGLLFAPPLGG